jgi:hypothetical protein
MRAALFCLAGLMLLGACAKATPAATNTTSSSSTQTVTQTTTLTQTNATPIAPAPPAGAAVSGIFAADGQQSVLTQVSAHPDDPFDGQQVTALVFTAKDQAGDPKAADDAMFGKFGDALVIRVEPDGTVIGAQVMHAGLKGQGSVSLSGVLTLKGYTAAGGQISGEITSGGPTDVFDHKLNVDLTFHTAAP